MQRIRHHPPHRRFAGAHKANEGDVANLAGTVHAYELAQTSRKVKPEHRSLRAQAPKVSGIPPQKLIGIILEQVNFCANPFSFARGEAANARVAMEANVHAFEQFLRGARRSRQQMLAVGCKTTDE